MKFFFFHGGLLHDLVTREALWKAGLLWGARQGVRVLCENSFRGYQLKLSSKSPTTCELGFA